jgi:hypothetical protein
MTDGIMKLNETCKMWDVTHCVYWKDSDGEEYDLGRNTFRVVADGAVHAAERVVNHYMHDPVIPPSDEDGEDKFDGGTFDRVEIESILDAGEAYL